MKSARRIVMVFVMMSVPLGLASEGGARPVGGCPTAEWILERHQQRAVGSSQRMATVTACRATWRHPKVAASSPSSTTASFAHKG